MWSWMARSRRSRSVRRRETVNTRRLEVTRTVLERDGSTKAVGVGMGMGMGDGCGVRVGVRDKKGGYRSWGWEWGWERG